MKKLLLILGAILLLLVAGVLLAPSLVPTETIKNQLTARVEAATGRRLAVDGALDLAVLPSLAVEMGDVRFANAPGSDREDMVALKELKVQLKLLPLLTGAVEVDQFVLVEPEIHLEIDAEGRPNWRLGEDQPASEESDGGTLPITDLKLGDIRLENGRVTYSDRATGRVEQIDAINMTVSLDDIQSPLEADGSLAYKGEEVTLDLGLDNPYAVLQGQSSPFDLEVAAAPIAIGFGGELSNGSLPSAAGDLDLTVPSIRGLADWLAEPIAFEGEGLERFELKGRLDGSAERVAFTDARIALDQIEGEGEVTAVLTGALPKVSGRLALGAVDLNPYLVTGEAAGDAETDTPPAGTEGEAAAADWSDEPIALPPIGGAELALELTVDSLKFQDIEIGETALDLGLADNVLTADLKRFQLYDGEGNGRLKVSAGSDGLPRIEQQFALSGLQAKPFLQAAADFDRLEGTATAEFDLATTGGTERQLVQNLNGKGRVLFADGAISGINIAAMVRNAGSAFLDANAGEARKTDFAELSGSFQVTDGVVANDNLVLQAPAARIGGSGKVDLPARQIDYRIEPKAAATLEGQGGAQDVSGILVPVIITGSLDDPKFTPDLAGLAERALEDPEALKEQIKQLEDAPDQIKKRLEELGEGADAEDLLKQGLGRALGGDAADEEGGEEAPAKLLRNLLGK